MISGGAAAMVIGGDPSSARPALTDYSFAVCLAAVCALFVWFVTYTDKTQPALRIWAGKGGWFLFGMALTFAMPLIDPIPEKVFP